uniref:Galectin n=1 Tax=Panagrellus redivivus TaxID=6233 RepID=A0A7E4UNA8_PANRE
MSTPQPIEFISDPVIPYATAIPGGVFPGRAITIRGAVHRNTEPHRFAIDLCCGLLVQGDHQDNKALHINPRFLKKKGLFGTSDEDIVLNSLINNVWGTEQRYKNVLHEGEAFTIRILVLKSFIKVTVNGRFLCDFVHRLPLNSINTIFIQGSVKVDVIEFEGGQTSGEIGEGVVPSAPPIPQDADGDASLYNLPSADVVIRKPDVPFVHRFRAASLFTGKSIMLTATPKMHASFFSVNLLRGSEDHYFFHLRVDFPDGKHDGALVRNHCIKRHWYTEERDHSGFPFKHGITFDLKIVLGDDMLTAHIDGKHSFNFSYRNGIDLNEVDAFTVMGDVTIQRVELK